MDLEEKDSTLAVIIKDPSLSIIKSEMGKVFGCYTDIAWKNNDEWIDGNGNTFVFSLRDDFNFIKL